MGNPIKLFIVEGEKRDYRFVNEMTCCFFKGRYEAAVINLPASQNIYMLYKMLEDDDFETDIVEILRDTVPDAEVKLKNINRQQIDEVYLFFDYDIHQNNVGANMPNASEIMRTMLTVFNNETDNGKLYVSYPMVEAIYDIIDKECRAFSDCYISVEKISQYKNLSGDSNPKASQTMDIKKWREVLNVFYLRLTCLLEKDSIDYSFYEKITPNFIFNEELKLLEGSQKIFVLSAFPEFLFDYFKRDFWNAMTPIKKKHFASCPKIC